MTIRNDNVKFVLWLIVAVSPFLLYLIISKLIDNKRTKMFLAFLEEKDFIGLIDVYQFALFNDTNKTHIKNASKQTVSNFTTYKTLDYLVKYFNFVINDETVYNLQRLGRIINSVYEYAEREKVNNKVVRRYVPSFTMQYTSPGGKSKDTHTFVLKPKNIQWLIEEINKRQSKVPGYIKERNKLTQAIRDSILARDNFTCAICGNSVYKEPNLLLEVDHIIPISKGGKTEPNNLQTLCWRCNRKKSDSI